MSSIRKRTSGLVALSVAGLLALGGVVLFVVVRAALTGQFDDGLGARAAALQSLTRFDGTKVEMDVSGDVLPRYRAGTEAGYFVVWMGGKDGWRELERSESLRGVVLPVWMRQPERVAATDCVLPDGRAGRYAVMEFAPTAERDEEHPGVVVGDAPPIRLVVAESRSTLDGVLWTVGVSIGIVGIGVVAACMLATRWAVGRGTRPLETLSARVATIGPETLDRRLSSAGLPTEIAPIADRINELLARLEEAFAREKRFGASASHELRTPIAELRMLLEVAGSRERTVEEWKRTGETAMGVVVRAQALCDALLRLSRANAGPADDEKAGEVDVRAIVERECARVIASRGIDAACVRVECIGALVARIDEGALVSIVGNLVENGVRHGEVSTDAPVEVVVEGAGGGVMIRVSNNAPGLTGEDVARLFEPFWRKDGARGSEGGFGLGLSVVRAMARAHGGDARAWREGNRLVVEMGVYG